MNADAIPLTIREEDADAPAPSPFLPGTKIQYAWDSTCLGMLKTCPRLYQYQMIEGWSPNDESAHLVFGQLFHHALEEYDRRKAEGSTHVEAMEWAIGDLLVSSKGYAPDPETKAGKYKSRDRLLALVIDYLDGYKDDASVTFLLEDGTPAVELSFRFELDWGPAAAMTYPPDASSHAIQVGDVTANHVTQPYLLCGHLDRVVTFADDLYVMDRKTSMSTLGSYYFDQYEPNNQMTLYTLASRVILESPVRGVIIDAAQIKLEENNEFKRGMTLRTPDQLDEWLKDLERWLAIAESYAEADYWPQNDTACGNYGGCKFREVCSKSPGVREQFLKARFTQKEENERWNPLKPR